MTECSSLIQPLLSVRELTIGWNQNTVVNQIGFDIAQGERVALVGESGSGKSITAIALLGLLADAQVSGSAVFTKENGEAIDLVTAKETVLASLRGREIAMIFQEPMTALNPLFSIGDQINESLRAHEGLSKSTSWRRVIELLERTGIQEPHKRAHYFPHQLSGGQRQRAMIAMALACGPRLLLADEPTTALDVTLRVQIMELLNRLQKEDCMAVLLISHDLGIVRSFSERTLVMEKGKIVEAGETQTLFATPQNPYTIRLLNSSPGRLVHESEIAEGGPQSSTVVSAEQVVVTYQSTQPLHTQGIAQLLFWRKKSFKVVDEVSFNLSTGRTLGIIGESGSGKTTLALALLGLLPCKQVQGNIHIKDQPWGQTVKQARPLRAVIQVVFQDPFSSLSPRMTIGDIVAEGLLIHHPHLHETQRMAKVKAILEDVGLSGDIIMRYPHEFSGGQRQRIAIARALIVEPEVLVLDEPTSALDVSIQMQVLELLAQLQQRKQLSYILITHDVSVVRALAHDVMVMRDGKIIEFGSVTDIMEQPQKPYTQILVNAANRLVLAD